jgi:hypothetical protein
MKGNHTLKITGTKMETLYCYSQAKVTFSLVHTHCCSPDEITYTVQSLKLLPC